MYEETSFFKTSLKRFAMFAGYLVVCAAIFLCVFTISRSMTRDYDAYFLEQYNALVAPELQKSSWKDVKAIFPTQYLGPEDFALLWELKSKYNISEFPDPYPYGYGKGGAMMKYVNSFMDSMYEFDVYVKSNQVDYDTARQVLLQYIGAEARDVTSLLELAS